MSCIYPAWTACTTETGVLLDEQNEVLCPDHHVFLKGAYNEVMLEKQNSQKYMVELVSIGEKDYLTVGEANEDEARKEAEDFLITWRYQGCRGKWEDSFKLSGLLHEKNEKGVGLGGSKWTVTEDFKNVDFWNSFSQSKSGSFKNKKNRERNTNCKDHFSQWCPPSTQITVSYNLQETYWLFKQPLEGVIPFDKELLPWKDLMRRRIDDIATTVANNANLVTAKDKMIAYVYTAFLAQYILVSFVRTTKNNDGVFWLLQDEGKHASLKSLSPKTFDVEEHKGTDAERRSSYEKSKFTYFPRQVLGHLVTDQPELQEISKWKETVLTDLTRDVRNYLIDKEVYNFEGKTEFTYAAGRDLFDAKWIAREQFWLPARQQDAYNRHNKFVLNDWVGHTFGKTVRKTEVSKAQELQWEAFMYTGDLPLPAGQDFIFEFRELDRTRSLTELLQVIKGEAA